jgi:hypothetical protein
MPLRKEEETMDSNETTAIAEINELIELHATIMKALDQLNLELTRASFAATAEWRAGAGAPPLAAASQSAAAQEWRRLSVEYPRRISDLCDRSAIAWHRACAGRRRPRSETAATMAGVAVSRGT